MTALHGRFTRAQTLIEHGEMSNILTLTLLHSLAAENPLGHKNILVSGHITRQINTFCS